MRRDLPVVDLNVEGLLLTVARDLPDQGVERQVAEMSGRCCHLHELVPSPQIHVDDVLQLPLDAPVDLQLRFRGSRVRDQEQVIDLVDALECPSLAGHLVQIPVEAALCCSIPLLDVLPTHVSILTQLQPGCPRIPKSCASGALAPI